MRVRTGAAASLPLAAALALGACSCGGSAARPAIGRVAVASPRSVRGWSACWRRFGALGPTPAGPVVERVGPLARSLTFVVGARVYGCDGLEPGRWCASSVGLRRRGMLVDPRLSLTCRSSRGRPVAFAWIEPVPTARLLVVEAGGRAEAYLPADGWPVRVTGSDVAGDSASFRVVQYAAGGRELDRRTVVVRVAG